MMNEMKLRVLTQNLRYRDDEGGNSVAERSVRLASLIKDYQPDIIGTQEATPLWTKYLNERFSDIYDMVGAFRDGVGVGGDEANYILYRKDRFTLLESETFWLWEKPEEIGKLDKVLCTRICTWALLRDAKTDEILLACNTHLDHSTDEIRCAQLKVLFERLGEKMRSYPTVFTGDFNMLRDTAPYCAVLEQGLADGQRGAKEDTSEVDYSCHLYRGFGDTIDYCFHNAVLTPVFARTISDDYDGYVSDHYGVVVDFVKSEK